MEFLKRLRTSALVASLVLASASVLVLSVGTTAAQAAVGTDQSDYQPGSVVTFNGDNSDGVGYLPGETVLVAVDGPGGITQSCDGAVDDAGSWSCQITLESGAKAIGGYSYTATGQTSGVSQSGTFTDSGCKNSNAIGTVLPSPDLSASFTTSSNTATYSITSTDENPSGGIPGLIEYCVYPGPLPDSATASYDAWTSGISPSGGYFDFERPNGNPTNLPFDGTTQTVGAATWSAGVPGDQLIILHINDATECDDLYGGNPGTCFVLPGGGPHEAQPPTVTKDAMPSFDRSYTWTITKGVDKTIVKQIGGSATFNYTINVSHDNGTDGNWQVNGTITVSNPNADDITGVNLADAVDNGGTCTVTNGTNLTVPGNGSKSRSYSCTYSSAPNPSDGKNTASATWPEQTLSPSGDHLAAGSASGSASFDFGSVSPNPIDEVRERDR